MHVCVVGAGAMGGSFAALLDRAGAEVSVIDIWPQHVQAINDLGLRLSGAAGEHTARVHAATVPDREGYADWVIVFVDANATEAAAETVAQVLKPDGAAITMQNGIGNVEALAARLGEERVIGGSSMCSAATLGPGRVMLTHSKATTIGELDGTVGGRVELLAELFRSAGLEIHIETRIMAKIWSQAGLRSLCAGIQKSASRGSGTAPSAPAPRTPFFELASSNARDSPIRIRTCLTAALLDRLSPQRRSHEMVVRASLIF